MQINNDGLVFIKIGKKDPWYINAASITRIIALTEESCKKKDNPYPTVGLDIVGREGLLYLEDITTKDDAGSVGVNSQYLSQSKQGSGLIVRNISSKQGARSCKKCRKLG